MPIDDATLMMMSGRGSSISITISGDGNNQNDTTIRASSPDFDDEAVMVMTTPQRQELEDESVGDGLRSMGPWNFALCGDRIISCGFWDHTIKCYGLDGLKLQVMYMSMLTVPQRVKALSSHKNDLSSTQANTNGGHRGPITCLQIGDDGRTLVTGGQDATCRVWVADNGGIAAALRTESAYLSSSSEQTGGSGGVDPEAQALQCVSILWGHDTAVISIYLSTRLDLLASGSVDGTIVLHQVSKKKGPDQGPSPKSRVLLLYIPVHLDLQQQTYNTHIHRFERANMSGVSNIPMVMPSISCIFLNNPETWWFILGPIVLFILSP